MRKLLLSTVWAGALVLTGCATQTQSITEAESTSFSQGVKADIAAKQTPVTQSITLYEAMARALKNNLDHRVAMMEIDLAQADYKVSRYDQLPRVVASGGYYGRSNEAGASSLSLLSGRQSLEPSTSTERDVFTGDLTATWNVLDFGLSKIRSEQLADEARIYEERRRKVIIQIMEDVHRAYFRAVSAERLTQRLTGLESDVRTAFDQSRSQFAARRTAPMPALSYQRELNDIQAQAQSLSRDMIVAKMELASLMGLLPDQDYTLQMPTRSVLPRRLAMSYPEMIDVALKNRPEVRESIYAQRIGEKEMKKAVLEALPSLEGFAGLDVSSNDFLFNNNWADYGARASWNLINVFSIGSRKKKAKARAELERQRTLAASMAVMTQVGVARARYESLMDSFLTANAGAEVQSDILGQIEALSKASSASRQTLVRERMNAIVSEARRDAIHAEMAEASAHIYTALGYDPYTAELTGEEDVATIAASLKTLWTQRAAAPGQ
ncbi:TolC family protein [Litorimonas sp. RW-G-Af-16]|uniref:TolC family protein n=1 Tax=Litorimonas sp. RW-G-Af-16 TaxID=3241168 RepID=UPI00390CC6F1